MITGKRTVMTALDSILTIYEGLLQRDASPRRQMTFPFYD